LAGANQAPAFALIQVKAANETEGAGPVPAARSAAKAGIGRLAITAATGGEYLPEAHARGGHISPPKTVLIQTILASPRIPHQQTRSPRHEDMRTFFVNGVEQLKAPSN
jgi:hypothetical protein